MTDGMHWMPGLCAGKSVNNSTFKYPMVNSLPPSRFYFFPFHPSAVRPTAGGVFGAGEGEVFLDDLLCLGSEASLLACPRAVSQHSCTHADDAGVVCGGTYVVCVCAHVDVFPCVLQSLVR